MEPGLECTRLVTQLHHIQAVPHHGHNQPLVPTRSRKNEVNIVLLQVFLRDPKEHHGHEMASLLHQDFNDLSYQILVPPFSLHCVEDALGVGYDMRSWWGLDESCAAMSEPSPGNFFFFLIKFLFWCLVSFFSLKES